VTDKPDPDELEAWRAARSIVKEDAMTDKPVDLEALALKDKWTDADCESIFRELIALRSGDDPRFDATDAAHPAWWRGHDRGAAGMRELVEKLKDELRQARARLAAVESLCLTANGVSNPRVLMGLASDILEALRKATP
jgi:hypothetical protein